MAGLTESINGPSLLFAPAVAAGPGAGIELAKAECLQGIGRMHHRNSRRCGGILEGRHFDLGRPTTLASPHVEHPCLDELASRELAQPSRGPAAQLCRPRALERAVAALSRLPPLVVSWEVEALRAKLAPGAARRAVPAAGRRLRRELRGLRIGQYRAGA